MSSCSNHKYSDMQEEQVDTDEFRDVSKKVERREALMSLRKAADIIDTTVQVSVLQHFDCLSPCAPLLCHGFDAASCPHKMPACKHSELSLYYRQGSLYSSHAMARCSKTLSLFTGHSTGSAYNRCGSCCMQELKSTPI